MLDSEKKDKLTGKDKAKNMAATAALALGALAWRIAQNVILDQGTKVLEDLLNKKKNE